MKKAIALTSAIILMFTLTACSNGGGYQSSYYEDEIVETIKPSSNKQNSNDATTDSSSNDTTNDTQTNTTTVTTSTQGSSSNNDTKSNHTHSYSAATCKAPATCSCGATSGNKADHTWQNATCSAPKTCTVCGITKGKAIAHKYSNGKCSVCGANEPVDVNTLMSGGTFVGNLQTNGSAITANGISFVDRSSGGLHGGLRCYTYKYELSENSTNETININNKKYYITKTDKTEYGIKFNDAEIIVIDDNDNKLVTINIIDKNNLKIISSNLPEFPVDSVFSIG